MRIFIASSIERFEPLSELFTDLTEIGYSKPVKTKELHLTFRFFGDLEEKDLDGLRRSFLQLSCLKFPINIRGIGAFPSIGRANVLFLNVENDDAIYENWKLINSIPPEVTESEHFKPHITISRFRKRTDCRELANKFKNIEYHKDVGKISLYRSTLTREGPVYEVIDSIQLK